MKNLLYILLVLLFSCTKYTNERTYTIHEGENYSDKRKISAVGGQQINFEFTFDVSHRYISELPLGPPTDFQNKLYGISSSNIHNNSARISWRESGDKFELLAYWYEEGVRGYHSLYFAEPGELLFITIKAGEGNYIFNVNGSSFIKNNTKTFKQYRAWPYFGGTPVCPHTMEFKITEF